MQHGLDLLNREFPNDYKLSEDKPKECENAPLRSLISLGDLVILDQSISRVPGKLKLF